MTATKIAWSAAICEVDAGLGQLASEARLGKWSTPVEAIAACDEWLRNGAQVLDGAVWEPSGSHRWLLYSDGSEIRFNHPDMAGLFHAVVAEIEVPAHQIQQASAGGQR